jgi:hypothetical protein
MVLPNSPEDGQECPSYIGRVQVERGMSYAATLERPAGIDRRRPGMRQRNED